MKKPNTTVETPSIGEPPAILQGHALAVWHETAKDLRSVGIGTRIEGNALSCYCQAVADFHAAQLEIDKNGMVIFTERGAVKHPATTIKNQAMLQILKFATAFGLTPASCRRVTRTAPPAKVNKFAQFKIDNL